MKKFFLHSILTVMLFVLLGCSSEDESYELSNRVNASTFTLNTPEGWTLIEDQGIDTYIGRIAGPEDTIYFDQGYLSFGSLQNVIKNEQTIFFQRLKINDVPSIIHKERRQGDLDGEIRLSVYLDAGDGQRLNSLYVFDPKDEALIIKIFKTHQFTF
ncbi:hypothetical protein WJR50_13105 [Catalinimonas sp. 4WD22]|uniref:hypothetical protein n=1 Tax=Catalinimonas locisalis TaxID=3133978 RepID=UPI00310185FB